MKEEFRTPPEISFEPGPGARLRQAREAANRGIGEISAALHLDPKMVEALEADSFDRLPPPTFVRGYLKGYARLLGLPPGPILEVYDRRGFGPPPLVPDVTEAPQAHPSDLAVRLATYGIAVALVVLVVLWWRSQDFRGFDVLEVSRDLIGWPPESAPVLPGGEGHGGSTAAGASPGARDGAGSAGDTEPPPEPPPAGGAAGGRVATAEPASPADGAAAEVMASTGSPPDGDSPSGGASPDGLAATEPQPPSAGGTAAGGTAAAEPPRSGGEPFPGGAGAGGEATPPPSDGDAAAGAAPLAEPPPSPAAADTVAVGAASAESSPSGGGDAAGVASTVESSPPPSVDGGGAATGAVAAASAAPAPGTAAVPGAGSGIPDRGEAPAREETDGIPLVIPVGPPVPETGSSLLVIEFTDESWVEIYDRDGATLFFDLVPPGRALRVTGSPPFDVLFGNSRDTRVTFDGEPFDYAPYVERGVARFSLGAAPESGPDATAGTVPPPAALPPSPDEPRPETP